MNPTLESKMRHFGILRPKTLEDMHALAELVGELESQNQVEKAQSIREYANHFITYLEAGQELALVDDDLERIAANLKVDRVVAYSHTIQPDVFELRPSGFNDGVAIVKDFGDSTDVKPLGSSGAVYQTLEAARLAAIKRGIQFLER